MPVCVSARCVAVCTALTSSLIPPLGVARSPCTAIHVKILGIRNSTGTIACALFESPAGFPTKFLRSAINIMVIRIRDTQARCDFENIAPGTYALAVIHDENTNGKLDASWRGIQRHADFQSGRAQYSRTH